MKKTVEERRAMIDKGHAKLSIVQQCVLLSINRSGLYYKPFNESKLNLELMRLMDENYPKHPLRMWGITFRLPPLTSLLHAPAILKYEMTDCQFFHKYKNPS